MSEAKGKKSARPGGKKIAPPKGTRDAYPDDVLRRRYVTQAWRDAAIRCGFDEIEGPTFEQADLYAVKSGEGILSELFQAFSGKDPAEIERVQETGKAPYALRPEFTPTLARMYAARAKQLPQPCKWFTAGPYFRAEKPQRGRLREFLQWNCDVIGLPGGGGENANAKSAKGSEDAKMRAEMDAEVIEVTVRLLTDFGFDRDAMFVQYSDRNTIVELIRTHTDEPDVDAILNLLDKRNKLEAAKLQHEADQLGFDLERFDKAVNSVLNGESSLRVLGQLGQVLAFAELSEWCDVDASIVRGLAYYTGTVFEVIADGERAVAGGGRYDDLIELFGGPPTPACGFGMGDVVLSNLLDDKGLFPEGRELMEAVSRPPASVRPEAFVIHDGSDEARAQVRPLVAALRRGVEAAGFDGKPWSAERYGADGGGVRPMHARQSYKATGNPGKLWSDAKKQHARYVIEISAGGTATLKSVDRSEPIASDQGLFWNIEPTGGVYVGRGLIQAMGG